MQAFKNQMREIQQNVKKTEETLGIIQKRDDEKKMLQQNQSLQVGPAH